MKPKVLITNHVPDDHLEPLLELAEIIKGPSGGPMCSREEVLALAPELDAIINQHELAVDRELLAAAPKLRIVANVAIGYSASRLIKVFAADITTNACLHEFYHGDTGQPLLKPGFLSWNVMALGLMDNLKRNIDPTTGSLLA